MSRIPYPASAERVRRAFAAARLDLWLDRQVCPFAVRSRSYNNTILGKLLFLPTQVAIRPDRSERRGENANAQRNERAFGVGRAISG